MTSRRSGLVIALTAIVVQGSLGPAEGYPTRGGRCQGYHAKGGGGERKAHSLKLCRGNRIEADRSDPPGVPERERRLDAR